MGIFLSEKEEKLIKGIDLVVMWGLGPGVQARELRSATKNIAIWSEQITFLQKGGKREKVKTNWSWGGLRAQI